MRIDRLWMVGATAIVALLIGPSGLAQEEEDAEEAAEEATEESAEEAAEAAEAAAEVAEESAEAAEAAAEVAEESAEAVEEAAEVAEAAAEVAEEAAEAVEEAAEAAETAAEAVEEAAEAAEAAAEAAEEAAEAAEEAVEEAAAATEEAVQTDGSETGADGGWVQAEGAVVLEAYEQSPKRGKKGGPNRLDVSFTFRNTTDKPLYGFLADILFTGYGTTLLEKPYQHPEEIAPQEVFKVEGSYPETSSASSVYKILSPMNPRDFTVALADVKVMFEVPAEPIEELPPPEPKRPPFDEVVTAPLLDAMLSRNPYIVLCFHDAAAAGVALSGTIHLAFTANGDGTTTNGHLVEEAYQGTALESCLAEQVHKLSFGEFAGESHDLKYPFRMQ